MKKYIGIAIVILTLSATNVWAATDFVPGLEFLQLPANAKIEDILRALYIWGIGFVALAAFFMFTYGGVLYLIAGDKDPSSAKSYMKNALYGLLLALGSYLILNTINPQLVSIKNLELPPINSSTNNNNGNTSSGTWQCNPNHTPPGLLYTTNQHKTGEELCKNICPTHDCQPVAQ